MTLFSLTKAAHLPVKCGEWERWEGWDGLVVVISGHLQWDLPYISLGEIWRPPSQPPSQHPTICWVSSPWQVSHSHCDKSWHSNLHWLIYPRHAPFKASEPVGIIITYLGVSTVGVKAYKKWVKTQGSKITIISSVLTKYLLVKSCSCCVSGVEIGKANGRVVYLAW